MPLEPKQEPPYYEITDGPAPAGTKYFTALLTQTATSAPTATILRNSLGLTPTYLYNGIGNYSIMIPDLLLQNKTWFTITENIQSLIDEGTVRISMVRVSDDELSIITGTDGVAENDIIIDTPIQIIIYP